MAQPVSLQPGDLVGVNDARGHQLAVVQSLRGTRVELRTGFESRLHQVPLREVERIAALPPTAAAPPGRLADPPWSLTPASLASSQPSSRAFGEVWALLVEEPGSWEGSLADLAGLLGSAADPALLAACWLWLHADQTLFRLRQARITPRRQEELRPLRQERRQQVLRRLRREGWLQRLQARQPLDVSGLTAEQRHDLNQLQSWAGGVTDQPLSDELQRLLRECHCPLESGPIRHLLVDLGQWERHHLPSLEATTWQHGFSPQLLEEADQLVAQAQLPFPGDGERVDRCGQRVVTIDDDDTLDIDDGLALETSAEGRQRLWIHIADPGRLVAAGTPLDLEARRRGTSLYLARGNLPMFPPQLAHGPMSLRRGERSAAWSLWVELDDQGAVLADGFERSWIRPTYRLSYADADELIELAPPQEADLLAIHQLLKVRHAWRTARGALNLDDPEGRIRCRGEQAELEVVETSPSRRLVAEAMVLAGSLVAERGLEAGLSLPFWWEPPQPRTSASACGPTCRPHHRSDAMAIFWCSASFWPCGAVSHPWPSRTSPPCSRSWRVRCARASRSPGRISAIGCRCGLNSRSNSSGLGCSFAGFARSTSLAWSGWTIWPSPSPATVHRAANREAPWWCGSALWIPCKTSCVWRRRLDQPPRLQAGSVIRCRPGGSPSTRAPRDWHKPPAAPASAAPAGEASGGGQVPV